VEYFTHMGETIRWISDQLLSARMSAGDTIIGDSIIRVILCLTMWEVGRILISFFSHFLVTVRSNDDIETAAVFQA
jgi:hypothetical protein